MKTTMPLTKNLSRIYLLTTLAVLLSTLSSSYAQNKTSNDEQTTDILNRNVKTQRTIPGEKTEEKGNLETYIVSHQGNYLLVYNKNNTLMLTYSSFMEYSERTSQALKSISTDKLLLDSYVKKILSPHFGGKSVDFPDISALMVNLYSDIDGNIKEISVAYPKEVNIPFPIIEKFERTILNGELKLLFDKKLWFYKDATWVGITYSYSVEKVQTM